MSIVILHVVCVFVGLGISVVIFVGLQRLLPERLFFPALCAVGAVTALLLITMLAFLAGNVPGL